MRESGVLPIAIVGSTNRTKLSAVQQVFEELEEQIGLFVIEGASVDSGVPEQPMGAQTLLGALERAHAAMRARPAATLGVGIEAGLLPLGATVKDLATGPLLDVQYCAILDRDGRVTIGHGGGFAYPPAILDEVAAGRTVGEAGSALFDRPEIGSHEGMIGYLTRGHHSRVELTAHAVLMALVPRLRPALYGLAAGDDP